MLNPGKVRPLVWALFFCSPALQAHTHKPIKQLDGITVSGTRLATDVQKYPGSVSIVTEGELNEHSTTIDALSAVPGVSLGNDSGRHMGQSFNIRGFGYQSEDRVIILQDGVRRSSSLFSNHVSSFRSDNDLLKRVEVVKGASSITHGSGAIGGVVSMSTKDAHDFLPDNQDFGAAAKMRYESNNYREAYLALAAAPEDKPFEILAYAKRGQVGDLRLADQYEKSPKVYSSTVDNDEKIHTYFLKGSLKGAHNQRVDLSYYDYKTKSAVTWQTLYHPGTSTVTGPVHGELTQQDWTLTYAIAPEPLPWLNASVSLYHSEAGYDRGYRYTNSHTGAPTELSYENKDKRQGIRFDNNSHYQIGQTQHRFVLGGDYEKRNEDAIYELNGVLTDFGSMPNTYKDLGLYFHNESHLLNDRLRLQIGGRYDRFNRSVKNRQAVYKGNHFSPRLGASFTIANGLDLLANYSEAFRAPNPHETSSSGALNPHYWYVPNPQLKPETVQEYEFGAALTRSNLWTTQDQLRFKAMYFTGRIQDMITLTPDHARGNTSPQGSLYASYQNVNQVKRHGLELSASYELSSAGISLSYDHLSLRDRKTGKKTPQAFADKIHLRGYYKPVEQLRLGAALTHWFKPKQDPETLRSAGRTYYYVREPFTRVDLNLQWQAGLHQMGNFGKHLELELGVKNLFNAKYMNASNVETSSRVGQGRNIYATLSSRF